VSLRADREVVDLGAAVVVVELAGDRPSGPIEETGDRIAKRRLASMSDVQRSGRIGGNKLDVYKFALTLLVAAE
jgi:hypothetical protein